MMRHTMRLLAVPLASAVVEAQQLPGRDLFDFPIAALAEGTALALFAGDGLRNPASLWVSPEERGRLSIGSLASGREQRVSAQTVTAAYNLQGTTFGLALARSSVSDIARTHTDPQSVGPDIPYGLLVMSAGAARRQNGRLTSGVALRYQSGEMDTERRAEMGLDAGVRLDSLAGEDISIAASSYLWRPGAIGGQRRTGAVFSAGVEATALRLPRVGNGRLRGGYSWTGSGRAAGEHFGYVSLQAGAWDARVGAARISTSSDVSTRLRLALGARSGRYRLGVAREESPYGLSPSYVFMLVTHLSAP